MNIRRGKTCIGHCKALRSAGENLSRTKAFVWSSALKASRLTFPFSVLRRYGNDVNQSMIMRCSLFRYDSVVLSTKIGHSRRLAINRLR